MTALAAVLVAVVIAAVVLPQCGPPSVRRSALAHVLEGGAQATEFLG